MLDTLSSHMYSFVLGTIFRLQSSRRQTIVFDKCICKGFVIYDDREGSTTKGQYFDVTLSADNYARLTVTPGLWMAFQGVGEEVNMLLNMASIEHNSDEAINCDLSEFKFDK